MTTINHRALRNEIRNIEGYRALSDSINAEIDEVASKSLDTEAAKQQMLGLDGLAGAYLGWVRAKREAVRSALWNEAARVIAGDLTTGLLFANSTVYGAALAMSENPVAVLRAQTLLNPYSVDADESDEDEADNEDEAEADAEIDA